MARRSAARLASACSPSAGRVEFTAADVSVAAASSACSAARAASLARGEGAGEAGGAAGGARLRGHSSRLRQ